MKKIDKKYIYLRPIKNNNLCRLGKKSDGGYVVDKNIIENCNTLITFGLGPDWSFELDYKKTNSQVKIYMYDYSVTSYPYIKQVLKYLKRFLTFRVKFEAVKSRIINLYSYINFLNAKYVNFFREKITYPVRDKIDTDIDKVFSRIGEKEKVVLKCDIEGSEFDVSDQILKYSHRIEMMIFEFHWLDKNEETFLSLIKKFQNSFDVIHIHGNNHCEKLSSGLPITLEMTLLNKKHRGENIEYVNNFPIRDLDYPNNPYKEDLFFSFEE